MDELGVWQADRPRHGGGEAGLHPCPVSGSLRRAAYPRVNPEIMREESEQRQRVSHKLKLCPEQYLPIIEGAIDGALKMEQTAKQKEDA